MSPIASSKVGAIMRRQIRVQDGILNAILILLLVARNVFVRKNYIYCRLYRAQSQTNPTVG